MNVQNLHRFLLYRKYYSLFKDTWREYVCPQLRGKKVNRAGNTNRIPIKCINFPQQNTSPFLFLQILHNIWIKSKTTWNIITPGFSVFEKKKKNVLLSNRACTSTFRLQSSKGWRNWMLKDYVDSKYLLTFYYGIKREFMEMQNWLLIFLKKIL